jgi:hypothetical protein
MAQDALNRFAERRNADRVKKLEELLRLINAMRTNGLPRARAAQAVVDISLAVRDEGIDWGELRVKDEDLPALENAAVIRYLKGLIRRIRMEQGLAPETVNGWHLAITNEIYASNGSITWDRLKTNGMELAELVKQASGGY